MQELILKYKHNQRRCRHLSSMMEMLKERLFYAERFLSYDKKEVYEKELIKVEMELDTLWDEQIELFFRIKEKGMKNGKDTYNQA